jgi:hypothetical protein
MPRLQVNGVCRYQTLYLSLAITTFASPAYAQQPTRAEEAARTHATTLVETVQPEQVPEALRDLADEHTVAKVETQTLFSNRSYSGTQRFLIDLGSGLVFTPLLTRRSSNARESEWSGTLTGQPDSRILLIATANGATFGTLQNGDSVFHISQLHGVYHRISFMLQSSLPDGRVMEGLDDTIPAASPTPVSQPASEATPVEEFTEATRDELPPLAECVLPATVGILVLYTGASRESARGELAMTVDSLARIAVGQTNDVLRESGVPHVVSLAGVVEVPYMEFGNDSVDLVRITDATTGIGRLARQLRRQYAADVVSLWIGDGLATSCGIGWIVRRPAQERHRGFHVVVTRCATTSYAFAHELSHTFGLAHNREFAGRARGAESWSYGYRATERGLATVEAYRSGCRTESGASRACTRILQLSNPHQNGMGVDHSIEPARSAMSAVTARKTMCVIARWSEQL